MAKPIIMTVDDEIQVLNAVARDLRSKCGSDYRIMKANSGAEALETLHQLKLRNAPVALIVSDQRMPEMSGTEFLAQVDGVYPEARKILLTAYADTEAAINSINEIGLDHYLMKPWDPPEQNLFPVVDDLNGAIFVGDRLRAGFEVDHVEAADGQADVLVDAGSVLVRSAVMQPLGHGGEGFCVALSRAVEMEVSGDAAHRRQSLPGRSALRQLRLSATR